MSLSEILYQLLNKGNCSDMAEKFCTVYSSASCNMSFECSKNHLLSTHYICISNIKTNKISPACSIFCHLLLLIFANRMDPDQDGPDLDPNCLTL